MQNGRSVWVHELAPTGMAQTEPGWDILLLPRMHFTFWYYVA